MIMRERVAALLQQTATYAKLYLNFGSTVWHRYFTTNAHKHMTSCGIEHYFIIDINHILIINTDCTMIDG